MMAMGGTSRAVSYLILCIKLGGTLPGTKTIPDYIVENRIPYFAAIETADEAAKESRLDVGKMETLLEDLLERQLASIAHRARVAG